jgi:Sigma-70, region 4/Bacterial RNA polymerase, alpha chain C terminal domain
VSSLRSKSNFRFGPDVPQRNDLALKYYSVPLQHLELSSRTTNALLRHNIKMTVGDLIWADESFTTIESLGVEGFNELETKVSQLLAMDHNETGVLFSTPNSLPQLLPHSRTSFTTPFKVLPEDVQKFPLDQLHLEKLTHKALIAAKITTIGDLNNISSSIIRAIRTFPPNALVSINSALISIHNAITQENTIDWFLYWKYQRIQLIRSTYSVNTPFKEVIKELPIIIEEALRQGELDERSEMIIKSRFGLDNKVKWTLEDIGNAFGGISGERVRQIERKTIKFLQNLFVMQDYSGKNYHIHPYVHIVIQKTYSLIEESPNKLVLESNIQNFLCQEFNIDAKDIKLSLALILLLMNAQCVEFNYPNAVPAWGYVKPERLITLENWIKRLDNLLTQETSLPISELKILAHINKKVKKSEVLLPQQLKYLFDLCNTIEKCEDGSIWGKFEYLKGRGNQVERLLTIANHPMSMTDIAREINHRLVPLGQRPIKNLTNQIINDERFVPIGRSGQWGLKSWTHIDTNNILNLMEQYLIIQNKPDTVDNIYLYVSERRPVSKHSISLYLGTEKERFVKVSLTKWGLAKWSNLINSNEWTPERMADFVAAIFKQNNTKELSYKFIKEALMKEIGLNERHIQGVLIHNPVIKTQKNIKGGERIAVFQPNYKNILAQTKTSKRLQRGELHQRIETSVHQALNAAPNNEMPMDELIQKLHKQFGNSETSLYQHLAQISFIERINIPNSLKKICRLQELTDDKTNVASLHEKISKSVRTILEAAPNKQINLNDLIKCLMKEYSCPKATLYQYIAALEYIERLEIPNSRKKLCCLKNSSISVTTMSNTKTGLDELIKQLQDLETGDGKAYEVIVKKILELCFREEFDFTPFEVQEQVVSYNGKRIRDFIIDNRDSTVGFWRDLKYVRKVEKILFDAKNYKNPIDYSEIANTLRYLQRNKAFGNFIIIISRQGVKDYEEFLEAYSDSGEVVLFLSDEDLIALINLKRVGKSASSLIAQKYHEFLGKK